MIESSAWARIATDAIAATIKELGVDRFELKYSNGGLGHDKLMTSIALYGEQVVPQVKELLAADKD